jgi:hypothetical protein
MERAKKELKEKISTEQEARVEEKYDAAKIKK